jgi:membrane protein DedA with SNARE-associated domain
MGGVAVGITQFIATFATAFIDKTGYITVFVGMVMESMVFPLPSEAILPFAGFLIAEGRFSFFGVIAVSTLASITGSLLSYWIGRYGGKLFVNRFGRYFLLDHRDLEAAERFFAKWGDAAILVCRFIPVVRHLISIPAGTGRMNLARFCLYTTIGAGLWNSFLTVVGYYLRQNWEIVMKYAHVVDIVVVVILVALLGLFIWKHMLRRKEPSPA